MFSKMMGGGTRPGGSRRGRPPGPVLTPLRRRLLAFVAEFLGRRGYPPSLREIGERLGVASTGVVSYHLRRLEEGGLLRRAAGASRAVEIVEHPFRLPVLGRVGAGRGPIAQEEVEERVVLDPDFARGAHYLLRVKGESMEGAGILEGDLVQVRRQDGAEDGELVVALIGEEGVVKRLRRRGGRWALESAHPRHPPIAEGFRIIGKVVGLLRRYER